MNKKAAMQIMKVALIAAALIMVLKDKSITTIVPAITGYGG